MKEIQVKSILNKHKKRDHLFLDDYSLNPYYGCSFNCIYCYIRGSKYGRNVTAIASKINAPELLEKELSKRAKKGEYGIIAISTATEPYMGEEKKLKLTRRLLKIILKYRFPVHILTKSTLVLRDMDLLEEIDENAIMPSCLNLKRGAIISFSFSTLDEKISKIVEPGAPAPIKRLEVMKEFEGFLKGVAFIPVLPFLSDSTENMEEMVKVAKEYGAHYALFGALTLSGEGKEIYYKFLEKYYPELIPKYNELYFSYEPSKEYQNMLEERAKKICNKYGIKSRII